LLSTLDELPLPLLFPLEFAPLPWLEEDDALEPPDELKLNTVLSLLEDPAFPTLDVLPLPPLEEELVTEPLALEDPAFEALDEVPLPPLLPPLEEELAPIPLLPPLLEDPAFPVLVVT